MPPKKSSGKSKSRKSSKKKKSKSRSVSPKKSTSSEDFDDEKRGKSRAERSKSVNPGASDCVDCPPPASVPVCRGSGLTLPPSQQFQDPFTGSQRGQSVCPTHVALSNPSAWCDPGGLCEAIGMTMQPCQSQGGAPYADGSSMMGPEPPFGGHQQAPIIVCSPSRLALATLIATKGDIAQGSLSPPTAGLLPSSGSRCASIGGSTCGSMGGPKGSSITGSMCGSVGGSRAYSTAGSMGGSMSGSLGGPRGSSVASSMGGSRAYSTAGSMGGSMAGSMGGPMGSSFASSMGGPTGGSVASSIIGSMIGSIGSYKSYSTGGSMGGSMGKPICSATPISSCRSAAPSDPSSRCTVESFPSQFPTAQCSQLPTATGIDESMAQMEEMPNDQMLGDYVDNSTSPTMPMSAYNSTVPSMSSSHTTVVLPSPQCSTVQQRPTATGIDMATMMQIEEMPNDQEMSDSSPSFGQMRGCRVQRPLVMQPHCRFAAPRERQCGRQPRQVDFANPMNSPWRSPNQPWQRRGCGRQNYPRPGDASIDYNSDGSIPGPETAMPSLGSQNPTVSVPCYQSSEPGGTSFILPIYDDNTHIVSLDIRLLRSHISECIPLVKSRSASTAKNSVYDRASSMDRSSSATYFRNVSAPSSIQTKSSTNRLSSSECNIDQDIAHFRSQMVNPSSSFGQMRTTLTGPTNDQNGSSFQSPPAQLCGIPESLENRRDSQLRRSLSTLQPCETPKSSTSNFRIRNHYEILCPNFPYMNSFNNRNQSLIQRELQPITIFEPQIQPCGSRTSRMSQFLSSGIQYPNQTTEFRSISDEQPRDINQQISMCPSANLQGGSRLMQQPEVVPQSCDINQPLVTPDYPRCSTVSFDDRTCGSIVPTSRSSSVSEYKKSTNKENKLTNKQSGSKNRPRSQTSLCSHQLKSSLTRSGSKSSFVKPSHNRETDY